MNVRIKARNLDEARRAAALLGTPEHHLVGLGHKPNCPAQEGRACDCRKQSFWLVREEGRGSR